MKKVKKKEKSQKIWPPPIGIEARIFEQIFPVQDLNLEGD